MPLKANIGSIVQSYAESFEDLSQLEKPKDKNMLLIDWEDIDPIFQIIGKGTCSIIRKVELNDHPGAFALKFLDPDVKGMNEERYRRAAMDVALEGKILERLDHPNIISLRGNRKGQLEQHINDEKLPYFLLLDYLPATLDNILLRKRRSVTEKLRKQTKLFDRVERTALGIARAMEYLHGRGLIFRDLKPANVGFDKEGTVKLFDLGLCRELAYVSKTGETLGFAGTPRYLATEVGAGKEYGLPSDVYSFGILLWEIAALRVPFDNIRTLEEYKFKVVQCHERPNISHVKSKPLQILIQKCWDPEPDNRPTFSEVRQQLEGIVQEHKETPPQQRFGSLRRRSESCIRNANSFRDIGGSFRRASHETYP